MCLRSNNGSEAPTGGPADALSTERVREVLADRYVVEGLLGMGGMGAVYRVFDRDVRETVALKLLLGVDAPTDPRAPTDPNDTSEPSHPVLDRFRREVRLARRVTHVNAARIYDLGHDGERWFLTMELVEGESLGELLQREGKLDVIRACRIAADACAGLAAIHAADVVHRDLKPANILLDASGRVVVTDFGIARTILGEDTLMTAGVIGTPGYMAPEQAMIGEIVDTRADLFALGSVLFVMLSGRHPAEVFAAAHERNQPIAWPPDVGSLAELPPELGELVSRCLQRRPGDRPPSAAALELVLRGVHERLSTRSPVVAPPTPASAVGSGGARAGLPKADKQVLAVLPLRFRGRDDDDIAGGLTEELIDLLSRTRELWVIGRGATARFAADADPQIAGRELKADFVVDGTVQRSGAVLRISIRLIEASSGVQLWAERVDGRLEDVFELQERLARKLAELLRVELLTQTYRQRVPAASVDLYLRGREKLRGGPEQQLSAVELLDLAVARNPEFAPAAAMRAMATLRVWFFSGAEHEVWGARARAAVDDALAVADELACTHEAAGVLALNLGEFTTAVRELEAAYAISPTSPFTNAYLGILRVETGWVDDGRELLEIAHELNPMLPIVVIELARIAALLDDWTTYERHLATLRRSQTASLWLPKLELRVACWKGDRAAVERALEALAVFPNSDKRTAELLTRLLRRELEVDEGLAQILEHVDTLGNLRYRSFILQYFTEATCYLGYPDRALGLIREALDAYLLDLFWLERCPVLAAVRALPGFAELHAQLRDRARSIWR
jgi:eukaryotic-like serine/threonine-protein kinase